LWRQPFGSPCRIRKSLNFTGMFSANALPLWRWQSVQLQVYSSNGSDAIS
jgi:hypothetical protein